MLGKAMCLDTDNALRKSTSPSSETREVFFEKRFVANKQQRPLTSGTSRFVRTKSLNVIIISDKTHKLGAGSL